MDMEIIVGLLALISGALGVWAWRIQRTIGQERGARERERADDRSSYEKERAEDKRELKRLDGQLLKDRYDANHFSELIAALRDESQMSTQQGERMAMAIDNLTKGNQASAEHLNQTLAALAAATQNMVQATEETQVQITALAIRQETGFVDISGMITAAVVDIRQALIDSDANNELAHKSRHKEMMKKVDGALLKLDKVIGYMKPPDPKPPKEVQPDFKATGDHKISA